MFVDKNSNKELRKEKKESKIVGFAKDIQV
jgi:hypothetical protein